MSFAHRVTSGDQVRLDNLSAEPPKDLSKEDGKDQIDALSEELGELLELLFAAGTHGLLLVLQGRDTAGKDGAIRRILDASNVQSTRVASFKVPTPLELAHDFLWRVHAQVPAKGEVVLFNRSHYEDVLVVRVHDLAPKSVWSKRFAHINAFEQNLLDGGTLILKFMLHITADEQERRLLDREKEVEKYWKLSAGDWKERAHWDAYTQAYEDALRECSHDEAPWYVVPANAKWFRDLAILEAVVERLRPFREEWMGHLERLGAEAKAEIEAFRAAQPG